MEREMKDSGIPWIGEIPKDWEIKPLKFLSHIIMGQSPNGDEIKTEGEIPFMQGNAEFGLIYPSPSTYCDSCNKHSRIGDILMSVRAPVGEMNMADKIYGIGRGLCSIKPINIFPKFLWQYLLKSKKDFSVFSNGSTFDAVTISTLNNFPICFPPLAEQKAIEEFLDRKCEEIDELIALQNKMIEELKAYKQSIITETVTKGLNSNVPLKDSGIEWIGEIPQHWEISRIKDIIESSNNGIKIGPFGSSLTGKISADMPYKIYGQWNIVGKDFNIGKNTISEETFIELKNYEVIPNDILISMMGTIGKCSIIPENIQRGIMDSHVVKIRLNLSKIHPKYFEYYYDKDNSNIIFSELNLKKKGSIMDGLNSTIIKNLIMIVPPLSEQQEIAGFLDKKCSEIDSLIELKQQKIDTLKEYKKSIIYEYVTGKKPVGTWRAMSEK